MSAGNIHAAKEKSRLLSASPLPDDKLMRTKRSLIVEDKTIIKEEFPIALACGHT